MTRTRNPTRRGFQPNYITKDKIDRIFNVNITSVDDPSLIKVAHFCAIDDFAEYTVPTYSTCIHIPAFVQVKRLLLIHSYKYVCTCIKCTKYIIRYGDFVFSFSVFSKTINVLFLQWCTFVFYVGKWPEISADSSYISSCQYLTETIFHYLFLVKWKCVVRSSKNCNNFDLQMYFLNQLLVFRHTELWK